MNFSIWALAILVIIFSFRKQLLGGGVKAPTLPTNATRYAFLITVIIILAILTLISPLNWGLMSIIVVTGSALFIPKESGMEWAKNPLLAAGFGLLFLAFVSSGFGAATARWTENLEHSVATGDWGAPKESTPSFARPNRNDLGMLEPITLNPGQHSVAIRDYKGRPLCWDEVVEGPIFQVHSRKRGGEWKRFLQSEISEIRFYLPQRAYGQAIIQVERKLTKPGVGCS